MRRTHTPSVVGGPKGYESQLAATQEKDQSGHDFGKASIQGQNFFEFIFNGCSFNGLRAAQSIFQHAEFTEARFSNCVFEDASFDHSDFVLADIEDSQFVRCSFQNAEWRDTLFENVNFRQCIFRNTTTSLTRFISCDFDEASATTFVGPSKRFSVFSNTKFVLPPSQLSFLQANFGITGPRSSPQIPSLIEDPLFELSLRRYSGIMASVDLYQLLLRALGEILSIRHTAQRLRLKYLAEVCKVCLEEQVLSVFAIQLLERALSRNASGVQNRDHALELMSLLLTVRTALRESVVSIEKDLAQVTPALARNVRLKMEFDHCYEQPTIENYLQQLTTYCRLPSDGIVIERLHSGSTILDAVIAGSVYVADICRFVRYSLSLATVSIKQAGQLRREYSHLTKATSRRKKVARVVASGISARKQLQVPSAESVSKELVGAKLENSKAIEVFVDTMNERVLVVDGRVRVTITLGS